VGYGKVKKYESGPLAGTWDFEGAWKKAWRRLEATKKEFGISGDPLDEAVARLNGKPVEQAREILEHFAPHGAKVLMALAYGTEPEELDRFLRGHRLIADIAQRSMAVVGLRPGEAVEREEFTAATMIARAAGITAIGARWLGRHSGPSGTCWARSRLSEPRHRPQSAAPVDLAPRHNGCSSSTNCARRGSSLRRSIDPARRRILEGL
jgi:hypothetical protein